MNRFLKIILVAFAAFICASCADREPQYATRAEKLLAVLNDPQSDYVMVISHRGDWRNWPENSIPAIESAIDMGVDMLEIDVKKTKDGVLVLSHDKTIDRMLNGKGYISDFTYDSLKTFKLKRAHNVVVDTLHITTLREALLCCKDRCLVNVDHAYDYYDEITALTEELGVTGQVLMKGKSSVDKVAEDMAKHEKNLLYMPIIDINKPKGKALFADYMEKGEVPLAYEVCWQTLDDDTINCISKIRETGSKVWVNTLWPSLCGGYGNDDDAAYASKDPASVYGKYLDWGVSMIQTDRPEFLIGYLRSIGRHD